MTALALVLGVTTTQAQTFEILSDAEETVLQTLIVQAASRELKQALGVSTITSEDLERVPVGRDLAEIIRTMPGVNLTGNTSSGQYGQQRQIDLRGMGPENTLILIDGKPVLSRNSARMGRHGERDTRGDSNWVPPDLIERIEVIRGPAAARYGSGAAGGVVNIITKRPTRQMTTVSTYMSVPESDKEGGTQRASITIGGPINDIFSYRLAGNVSMTQPDAIDINEQAAADAGAANIVAGREGVVQYDLSGQWSAQLNADHRLDLDLAWSRQGNRFVGGQPSGVVDPGGAGVIDQLAQANAETSSLQRSTVSLTHQGIYDFGESSSYVQWEHTQNRRVRENTATGGGEAQFNRLDEYRTSYLDNLAAKTEWDFPIFALWNQTVTLGAEYRGEFLQAPIANESMNDDTLDSVNAHLLGLFLEDNILVTDQLTVTPGLRADFHSNFGANLSPSLNASYALTDEITVKAGIARAFKAPNLFQLSPDYYYNTMGMGCPAWNPGGPCRVVGNPDLDPEISVNKEIGIAYANADGLAASLTYYHNDYENKITSGDVLVRMENGAKIFAWENSGPAVISGLEGSLTIPLHETVSWTTNFTKVLHSEREAMARLADGTDALVKVPVSLVPDYTINTSLRWEPMESLGLTLSATHYGEIKPSNRTVLGAEIAENDQIAKDPYTTASFSLDYQVNENVKLAAGVNNLLNTRQFATSGTTGNANTYNEPGRSYYLSLTGSF
ncbi:FepA family TonB-dependent siderophore receptor [Devosia honganensis]|uniref:FepA family TonB-dependent siderophore receptor n=1 Tax=Devosia honganensis TaxID=1610527 RepID=A0ABV7X0X7_9HYPH